MYLTCSLCTSSFFSGLFRLPDRLDGFHYSAIELLIVHNGGHHHRPRIFFHVPSKLWKVGQLCVSGWQGDKVWIVV